MHVPRGFTTFQAGSNIEVKKDFSADAQGKQLSLKQIGGHLGIFGALFIVKCFYLCC